MSTALPIPATEPASESWEPSRLLILIGVVALYVPGALLAIALADAVPIDAIYFPSAGIVVAALLLLPRHAWPAVLAGAMVAELGIDLATGNGLATSAGFAAAGVAGPLIGAALTMAACRAPIDLARRRHTAAFVLGAVIVGPAIGGGLRALVDRLGAGEDLLATTWQWSLADSLGVVTIGGAILAWRTVADHRPLRSPAALALLGLTVALMSSVVGGTDLPLESLVAVTCVAAAAFLGVRSATSTLLVAVSTFMAFVVLESGALWSGVADTTALAVISAELIVVGITGLMVAAEVTDRRRAESGEGQLLVSLAAEKSARRRSELLEQSARNLAAAADVGELAASVLSDLEETVGIEWGRIIVSDEDGLRVVAQTGDAPSAPPKATPDAEAELPGPVAMRDNVVVSVDDPAEIAQRFPSLADREAGPKPGAVIGLPLRSARGKALGALEIATDAGTPPSADTRNLLARVADQTGHALERAELHEQVVEARNRDHDVAVQLQLALLPETVVENPNLSISADYEAAGEAMAVGGDWYDTFSWSSGHIGLFVGDVCGHDLAATITMGRLRAAMAATAPLCHPDPAAVMDALDHLARGPGDRLFATAVCLIIDPATGYVRYTAAGHPPPLVVNPDASIEWLDQARTAPAGTIAVDERPRAEMQLEEGSILLLYSDGLIERRGEDLDAGLERLARTAKRGAGLEPEAFMSALRSDLGEPGDAEDDSIILCTRWQRSSQP